MPSVWMLTGVPMPGRLTVGMRTLKVVLPRVDRAADEHRHEVADGSLGDLDLVSGETHRTLGVLVGEVRFAVDAGGGIADVKSAPRGACTDRAYGTQPASPWYTFLIRPSLFQRVVRGSRPRSPTRRHMPPAGSIGNGWLTGHGQNQLFPTATEADRHGIRIGAVHRPRCDRRPDRDKPGGQTHARREFGEVERDRSPLPFPRHRILLISIDGVRGKHPFVGPCPGATHLVESVKVPPCRIACPLFREPIHAGELPISAGYLVSRTTVLARPRRGLRDPGASAGQSRPDRPAGPDPSRPDCPASPEPIPGSQGPQAGTQGRQEGRDTPGHHQARCRRFPGKPARCAFRSEISLCEVAASP